MERSSKKAVIIGISGCSSSGKTTLARLLRDILPNTYVLHEDDFYKPEKELPSRHGFLDWDCAEAVDIQALKSTLEYIQTHGEFPPTFVSKEDQNTVSDSPVNPQCLAMEKAIFTTWLTNSTSPTPPIFILDGFLLYPPSMAAIQPFFDLKLFLRTKFAKVVERREARKGYVTLEGFWEDPPGYVEKIVWPNYVEEHASMFEGGDVEGKFRDEVVEEWGIVVQDGNADIDMVSTLDWALRKLLALLGSL